MIPSASDRGTSFGDRVRRARQELRHEDGRRWTQGELAAAVGVERNTVSRWENGGVQPRDTEQLARLARVLRVSVEWLVSGGPRVASGAAGAAGRGARGALGERRRRGYASDGSSLPVAAQALIAEYCERLAAAGCSDAQIASAQMLMAAAATNQVVTVPLAERIPSDIVSDVDAAWDLIVRVLRREGVRL